MATVPPTDHRPWGWFAAWVPVGAAWAVSLVGILTVGIFVLPFAVLGTVLLARSPESLKGIPGLIAGIGLPPLYVAYLNRSYGGPACPTSGTVTYGRVGVVQQCNQALDPLPWLAAGLLLVAAGVVVFLVRSRRSARQPLVARHQ